jgi:hypothetical protein
MATLSPWGSASLRQYPKKPWGPSGRSVRCRFLGPTPTIISIPDLGSSRTAGLQDTRLATGDKQDCRLHAETIPFSAWWPLEGPADIYTETLKHYIYTHIYIYISPYPFWLKLTQQVLLKTLSLPPNLSATHDGQEDCYRH